MRKRRLCHILFGGLGGHARVVSSLIEGDIDQQCEHSLLFFGVEPVVSSLQALCHSRQLKFGAVQLRPGHRWRAWWELWRALVQLQPDRILLHSGAAALLPALLYRGGGSIVYVEHTPNALKTRREWLGSYLAGIVCKSVVYLSSEYRDEIRLILGPWFQNRKHVVIPNGVSTARFGPARLASRGNLIRIGMAGRVNRSKDQAVLIRTLSLLRSRPYFRQLRLDLAGDGELLLDLKQLVSELGLEDQVRFWGTLDESALVEFYAGLDIYAQSTFGETFPMAILEAQACGLPVVGSNAPGVRSLICDGKTGLVCPSQTPVHWAETLEKLIVNPKLRNELGVSSRQQVVDLYGQEAMWRTYQELLD